MLRDNLVGLIAPMQSSGTPSSDDRSSCLEILRPIGAESSLTESTSSPFQTEPRQVRVDKWIPVPMIFSDPRA